MLNNVTIMGRIGHELDLKQTPSGTPVLSFTIGCDRNKKDADGNTVTDWIRCVAWDKRAEMIDRNFDKGDLICLTGRMQTKDWTDKDGQKRRDTELSISSVFFCESRASKQARHGNTAPQQYYAPTTALPEDYPVPWDEQMRM